MYDAPCSSNEGRRFLRGRKAWEGPISGTALKLIVGLGNPGSEYARTRHNAGFWLVDELARRHGGTFRHEGKHQAELARVRIGGEEVWLVKPMTFMNRSGGPVSSVLNFYKIPPAQMLVAHDEIDLPSGTIRLKDGGGAGGHNGLRDLIAAQGEGFWRLRIGVGHPGTRHEVVDFVLTRAGADEQKLIDETILAGADAIEEMMRSGAQIAMNKLHTRGKPAAASGKEKV